MTPVNTRRTGLGRGDVQRPARITPLTRGARIDVIGAGVIGLWQALALVRAGFSVRLLEQSQTPFTSAASRYAGAMLAPFCEAEEAPDIVRDLGHRGAALWSEAGIDIVRAGTLVVAPPRDQSELRRFARATVGHEQLDRDGLKALEPDLSDRFANALYFPDEAHMTTPDALRGLLSIFEREGGTACFGQQSDPTTDARTPTHLDDTETGGGADWVVDCRGLGAADTISGLRGVRGERVLLHAPDVALDRPVRLLHPRQPLYVVPWTKHRYLVGATVIESDDDGPMTVRSALDLLGLAYTLHPGFAEAQILELSAGVRPSFSDNVPRVIVDAAAHTVHVNGAYRHGFLLAPALAEMVQDYLMGGAVGDLVVGAARGLRPVDHVAV